MAYSLPSLRRYNPLLLLLFCCCSSTLVSPTSSYAKNPTKLVESVCKNTTTYAFCVDSLYSDPRTPTADAYVLAFVSFDLAYANATSAEAYVRALLGRRHRRGSSRRDEYSRLLERCDRLYGEAVSALALALNDLDSETYSELASYAADSARKAGDCQAAFRGTAFHSPLTRMNRDLRGLAGICIIVSHLFTAL
ncbi:cell wall / vacuolar inhibitor of fructosidase 2-like [Rhododendron vialii]|uniref:cell wall / vacuolar inhibitor of fructosidase 2-like n=1 Tax=Rhododendron vialii TaxID=182163 RepID=UPI00265EED8B|nr:cell wall / vacuolar inhibitor of fructosidase 2-like [Rhododendron vialii]